MSKNLKIKLTYEEDIPVYYSLFTPVFTPLSLYKNTVPVPAGGSRDETIIVTNSGPNYPYSSYYPTNPYSRYPSGANSGTTVIVSNPDGNYNRGYGTKYIPTNTYG
ncbi:uncharacterized protein LOC123874990 isoform X3 [Maniola jurtina]|uniref:uncharacterized protein LOC123874990 isoform X3 n=1 Tax=Maniola jurtina TaxID=191418 RepID=UPI001E68773F|nr:uncharacterized protein LOC123874990 isoform X3 [Maniola jurtina]